MAEQTLLIGRRIAEAREEARLTQAELAAQIPGKSDGTQVSKWERGVHRPSDDTLEHIAQALKRPVAWFLVSPQADVPTPDLSTPEPAPAPPDLPLRELVEAVRRLEEQTRLLRAEAATRDAEVLTQIAEVRQTIRGLRRG